MRKCPKIGVPDEYRRSELLAAAAKAEGGWRLFWCGSPWNMTSTLRSWLTMAARGAQVPSSDRHRSWRKNPRSRYSSCAGLAIRRTSDSDNDPGACTLQSNGRIAAGALDRMLAAAVTGYGQSLARRQA